MTFVFRLLSRNIAYGKNELKLHKIHYSHSRFFSLHTFFLRPGICKFAVDFFIEPSKKKITVPKNT